MDDLDVERLQFDAHLARNMLQRCLAGIVKSLKGDRDSADNRADVYNPAFGGNQQRTERLRDLKKAKDVDVKYSSRGSKICVQKCRLIS